MISLTLLFVWAAAGMGIAAALSGPGQSRWAWAPLAAVFGPLWVSVAMDQRAVARTAIVPAVSDDDPSDSHVFAYHSR